MEVYCSKQHANEEGNRFCTHCGEPLPLGVGQVIDNRYQILRQLGQGCFGRTYLAEEKKSHQACVLKEFAPQVQEKQDLQKAKELFEREANVLKTLQHSQIPRFHASLQVKIGTKDFFFLVQDYIDGDNYYQLLEQRESQGKTFSEEEIITLLQQILPVLSYIHSRDVVHRDISPENLIWRRSDNLPVLIDFGGMKQLPAIQGFWFTKLSGTHTLLGKKGYAPEEQLRQGKVSYSSDLYSLAVTCLVLLTGKEPQQLYDSYQGLWRWGKEIKVTPKLEAILKKMLAYKPSDRYQSAAQILQDLQPLQNYVNYDRQKFLTFLKNVWIQGVLEKKLREGQVLNSLKLEQRLDAVTNPSAASLKNFDQLRQTLPPGARVIDLFYQLDKGRTLLILGEPAVGKTTALLELASELIDRAEQNTNQPIPVIFNLSSWKKRESIVNWFQSQTIADWVVQELQNRYQVSKSIGQAWLKNQQLLLLLDGLDEVRGNSQDACVQALNQFTQEYSMVDMVVTSRIRDYETLKHRLKFQSAIYLSPVISENQSQQATKETESGTFAETAVTYSVLLTLSSQEVQLGGEIEVTVYLGKTEISNENSYLLKILQNEAIGNELNLILNAPGFQFNGDNTASLPLDLDTDQETQTARFRLTALRLGTANITAELYRGNTFETKLETQIQVADIDEASFTAQRITPQPRPIPQPDFILRIQTIWNDSNSTCKFQYLLKSFRFLSVFPGNNIYTSESLSSSWIEQVWGLLATTLENISGSLSVEGNSRLISLGQYLFEQVFPSELQSEFRSLIPQNSTFTLLIIADQEAWIPWELLHDGQRFLGDRFIIGRWLWELNDTRPYEFPVGAVNVAQYANVEQPQLWATLLEAPGAPPPQPLPEGVLHDGTGTMWGLHLIRYSQSANTASRRNAPVTLNNANDAEDIEQQMLSAKLNLRRNRPLVTLSYLQTEARELTALEQTWASAFIRAGCSGFMGSLWAVESSLEAAFISCFYNRLWTGASLGEAFYTSRQLARIAAPDSVDWLAYVLFGDPMARPYLPVEGKGYAVVEPIGRDIDEPMPVGVSLRFRLSLRRTPPIWHEERVMEVAEDLKFENLQVHVKTLGLEVIPNSIINMSLDPTRNYLGWFTLVAPPEMAANSALVQVFFMDGNLPVHSLMFSLNIANQGCEPA